MLRKIDLGYGVLCYGDDNNDEDFIEALDLIKSYEGYFDKVCDGIRRQCKAEDEFPRVIEIIFNKEKGVTVIRWGDGTKTKVTLQEGDTWDSEKAIALCFMKKILGNQSLDYFFNKYCK